MSRHIVTYDAGDLAALSAIRTMNAKRFADFARRLYDTPEDEQFTLITCLGAIEAPVWVWIGVVDRVIRGTQDLPRVAA